MLPVVTIGYTLQIIGLTPGIATIISAPSTKVFSNLVNGIYRGIVNVQVSGCTQGTYTQTSPVVGTFITTTISTFIEELPVLRETDITTPFNVNLQNTAPPFDNITVPITVQVISAGQNKILSN